MNKRDYIKKWVKIMALLLAISMIFGQTMTGMATEESAEILEDAGQKNGDPIDGIKYITDIAGLSEGDTYFSYEKKLPLKELQTVFPRTLTVILEGETNTSEIEVTWECETDYETLQNEEEQGVYIFAPKWDESVYAVSEEASETIEIPLITVEIMGEEIPLQIKDLETARKDLLTITEQKPILALVYLCNQYDIKESPSEDSNSVITVTSGQSVQIEDVELDKEGSVWYKVLLYQKEETYSGYIEKKYLATSDEDFLDWTEEYIAEEIIPANRPAKISVMSIMSLSAFADVNQFPASYQNKLLALKQKYPNWIFVKMETGLDFNTAVSNEMGNKSWISSSKPASWKNGAAAQSGWSYASEGILRYYMDPRNFLTESAVFQFEQLTYNESYHTENAVQAIIAGSFMSGDIPGEGMTYAGAFTQIGQELKISPFHLASRVLQEQGTRGTSALISGTYPGYEGYYNYFNVGASGKDDVLIKNGLTTAMAKGWNSRYKSLRGGAAVIGENYILRGQDTLYLQKFNVTSNSTYNHQYMQNIMAPASEAPNIMKAYSNTGSLNNSFVFKIPVYSNMPASACPQPDTMDEITLNKTVISELAVDKTEKLIPYINGSMVDNVSGMTFNSSNTDVAAVDAQGNVKAVSPGTAVITCAKSGAVSATCTITVIKAEPVVDTPVINPVIYKPGLKLADISLPAGWNWKNRETLLNAGTASHTAVYTPSDTTKYLTVERAVSVKVTQAFSGCDVPMDLTAKLGSKLGSVILPDEFFWESDVETILDKAGEHEFYVTYVPNDANYYTIEHISVIVKVIDDNRKPAEPDNQGGSQTGGGGTTSSGSTDNGGTTSSGSTGNSGTTSSGSTGNSGTTGGDNAGNSGTTSSGGTGNSGTTSSDSTGSGNAGNGNSVQGSGQNTGSENANAGGTNNSEFANNNGSTNIEAANNNGTTNHEAVNNSDTANSGNIDNNGAISNGSINNSKANNGNSAGNSTVNNRDVQINGMIQNSSTESAFTGSNNDTLLASVDSLAEESKNAPVYERPSVTIDMEDLPILTGEMLQMAREQNVDLTLRMNNRATWRVHASSAQGGFSNIDMNVAFDKDIIPEGLLTDLAEGNEYLEFSLAHEGPFGFGAELEIALNPEDSGMYANLFYYDSEQETLEFMCAVIIGEDGEARFPMEHASDYVIIISEYSMEDLLAEDDASGSVLHWILLGVFILMVLVVIGYAGYFYWQKRREDDEEEDEGEEDDDEDIDIEEVEADTEDEDIEEVEAGAEDANIEEYEADKRNGYTSEHEANTEYEEDTEEYETDIEYDDADEEKDIDETEDKSDIEVSDTETAGSTTESKSEKQSLSNADGSRKTMSKENKFEGEVAVDTEVTNDEDDWIEDQDWQEPEKKDPYADDHAENDWIEDDEWDIGNDWMDDDEWEKKNPNKE